jgi:hypothetical protein
MTLQLDHQRTEWRRSHRHRADSSNDKRRMSNYITQKWGCPEAEKYRLCLGHLDIAFCARMPKIRGLELVHMRGKFCFAPKSEHSSPRVGLR